MLRLLLVSLTRAGRNMEYTRLSTTILETTHYELFKGVGNEPQKLPKYLVRNKTHDVIEFENESLYMARGWMEFFDPKIEHPMSEDDIQEVDFPDNVIQIKPN